MYLREGENGMFDVRLLVDSLWKWKKSVKKVQQDVFCLSVVGNIVSFINVLNFFVNIKVNLVDILVCKIFLFVFVMCFILI